MSLETRSNLQGKRIKIYTRSFSLELYIQAKKLFEIPGVEVVRLTDQSADGYFYSILKEKQCDIAINIDEDAFVVDPEAILDLADYMLEHGYTNCGIPDGGVPMRGCNPIVTNPFFNILDLSKIREQVTSISKIKKFDYEKVKEEMIKKFSEQIEIELTGSYNFDCIDYEPYYPFFFWLAFHFKTLYLPCERHQDGYSTILYSNDHCKILVHSWLSRFYKIDSFHTQRIDALIDEAYQQREIIRPLFSFQDKSSFL